MDGTRASIDPPDPAVLDGGQRVYSRRFRYLTGLTCPVRQIMVCAIHASLGYPRTTCWGGETMDYGIAIDALSRRSQSPSKWRQGHPLPS
jgi:hypothetical protein